MKKKYPIKKKNNKKIQKNVKKENKLELNDDIKEDIYAYNNEEGNKILYTLQKISNYGTYYELRYINRTKWNGRAEYMIITKQIIITQQCTIQNMKIIIILKKYI